MHKQSRSYGEKVGNSGPLTTNYVPLDESTDNKLVSVVCRSEPVRKLRCSINVLRLYLRICVWCTHIHIRRRVHGYRITSIFRYLCRHSRHNDVTQAEHPSLSWILTTLKLTCFFAKEEALHHLPSEGEGRFRDSVSRAQFRCKANCPNEKSFFDFY